jgi:uncharacterized protein (TIGR02266 family)
MGGDLQDLLVGQGHRGGGARLAADARAGAAAPASGCGAGLAAPAVRLGDGALQVAGEPARGGPPPAPTVLLAERHPTARRAREREFAQAGFSVLTIPDEGELVRWLLQVDPDVLVLDCRLAGPGAEVVQWMREHPRLRRAGCYAMALVPTPREREMFLEAGADWYIDKNALVNSLPAVVRAGLDPTVLWPPPPTRRSPRVRVTQPVEFIHARRMASGESLNISQTGMFLKATRVPDVGAHLLLSFTLPGHRRWECFAQVAWIRRQDEDHPYPPGMGLQFLELESEAEAALAGFLATQAPATPAPRA